jgi:large repetitive protein
MTTREVVFVDASIVDAQRIINSLSGHADYILLKPDQDGLTQIKNWALTHTGYDAIHLISHGDDGMLQIGNASITGATLNQRAGDLDIIRTALAPNADLLIYGCNVAASEVGASFLNKLSSMLDADVAASTDLTGGTQGDEVLEYVLGEVQTQTLDLPELTASLLDPADTPVVTYTIAATDAWGARGYATEFATILTDNSTAMLFNSGKTLRIYNTSGTLTGTVDVNTLLTNGANGVIGLSNGNILVYGEITVPPSLRPSLSLIKTVIPFLHALS